MRTSTLEQLRRHLRPGRVYRREDLLQWSRSVDRHLKELTVDGTLHKLRTGLYYSPRKFEFGEAPADEQELVKAFLKTDRFVVTSPNAYNQLGLGGQRSLTTNGLSTIRNRHGTFPLGNRNGHLRAPHECSKATLTRVSAVDFVNELGKLAEDRDTPFFSRSRKSQRDGPEKAPHGQFLSTASVRRRKSSERGCKIPAESFW